MCCLMLLRDRHTNSELCGRDRITDRRARKRSQSDRQPCAGSLRSSCLGPWRPRWWSRRWRGGSRMWLPSIPQGLVGEPVPHVVPTVSAVAPRSSSATASVRRRCRHLEYGQGRRRSRRRSSPGPRTRWRSLYSAALRCWCCPSPDRDSAALEFLCWLPHSLLA